MKNASQKTIQLAVAQAKAKGVHVVVGWLAPHSLRNAAEAYPCGKAWPGRRKQNQFREIVCVIRPDGTIEYY